MTDLYSSLQIVHDFHIHGHKKTYEKSMQDRSVSILREVGGEINVFNPESMFNFCVRLLFI